MAPPAGHDRARERWVDGRTAAFLALPLAVAAWRFAPITRNYFFADDLMHFFQLVNLGSLAHLVALHGGHSLFTRNLLFQALCHAFGPEPAPYFWLAFATHLVNVGLLFAVIRVFARSEALGCFGAVLWGASPINEGTLGWFAVYGQALMTGAALWILLDLGRVAAGARTARWMPARWIALLIAASTSFGTGIAFAVVLPVAAGIFLPAGRERRRVLTWLAVAALGVVAFYVGQARVAAWVFHARTTQLPAMISATFHFAALCRLLLGLLTFGMQSLLLQVFAAGPEYPNGLAIGAAVGGFGLLGGGLLAGTGAERRALLAFVLLAAACYGIIAIGRVPFSLRIDPDRLVTAARYHYAGPALLTVALCVALAALTRERLARRPRRMLFGAATGLVAAAQITMSPPIDNHDGYRAITMHALSGLRSAIRSAPPGADVYIENTPFFGVGPLLVRNPRMFPGMAALFTIFFPENVVEGRRVHFVESKQRSLRNWGGRGRVGPLLVPPRGQKAIRIPP